jgi:TonB dependent receptor
VPAPDGGAVQFHTDNLSFYAEDQWQATPRFELTYGIRFDIPIWLDKPPYNSVLDTSSVGNINNSSLPSGQIEFSPRVGFNYDVTADHNNPVHGGVGVFSGPPAYVWLSNSFQNSGYIGYNQLTCNSGTKVAPTLNNGTVANPPTTCANGVTAGSAGEIDYTDKNFHYPQDLKASLGYDPHLPWGVTAHASYLFTHAIYAPIFQNAALAGPIGTGPYGNAIYGLTPNNPAENIPNRTEIFELTNTNKNWSYDITGGLSKQFSRALNASIYYTYSQARDVQSITSTTSASSYTYSWSPYWNQSQQRLGISNFQTPHKVTASVVYEMPWHTILAATYIGTSGQPYTLTYGFDANGDGVSGNDPIYVPKNVTDPSQIMFAATKTMSVAQQQQLLQTFLNENPCLARQEGHFMARNSCSTPWQNTMNVSLQQGIHFLHTQSVTLHCEVFNFLNLLSKNWGQIYEGEGSETLFNQPSTGPSVSGGVPATANGKLTTGVPIVNFTSLSNPGKVLDEVNSNWQMQFGIRYAF